MRLAPVVEQGASGASLVGSLAVKRDLSGTTGLLWQRIDGGHSKCNYYTEVFTDKVCKLGLHGIGRGAAVKTAAALPNAIQAMHVGFQNVKVAKFLASGFGKPRKRLASCSRHTM